jgi:hypothetical protein
MRRAIALNLFFATALFILILARIALIISG